MLEKISVPDIGDYSDVAIIEIAVKVGDTVKKDESLITLETDKASMEIPSPKAGVIKELLVKLGDKVSRGSEIIVIEAGANDGAKPQVAIATQSAPAATTQEPKAAPVPAPIKPVAPVAPISLPSQSDVYAGPGVRRYARELGVDLNKVNGTGRKERIVEHDVQNFVQQSLQGGDAVAPRNDGGGYTFSSFCKHRFTRTCAGLSFSG